MGRLRGNPEKRDFFEDHIHDFDFGNSFFILITSLGILARKLLSARSDIYLTERQSLITIGNRRVRITTFPII